MKILYAGWGVCGINGLQHILSRGDIKPKDIVALSTEESSANMISDYYKSLGVKCVSEEEILRSEGVEFDILVSVHWRRRISSKIIKHCNGCGINLHPSLLPQYAGCSSLAHALLNGEKLAGYSWHFIEKDYDTGRILLQEPVEIRDEDTAFSLFNRVNLKGTSTVLTAINLALDAGFWGHQQDLATRTYYPRGFPSWEESKKKNPDLDINVYNRASFFPGKNR